MLLLSNNISIIQRQYFSGDLYISDTAEEICDRCFAEVTMKQIGSHGNMADTLPRWTHLHKHKTKLLPSPQLSLLLLSLFLHAAQYYY